MVRIIYLQNGLTALYLIYGGMLIINAALPAKKILELIEENLELE
jgi:hypothetical protein